MVVFGQDGDIRAKLVLFSQIWLYSGNSGCTRAKWLYSITSVCIRAKLVAIGRKWFYSGKNGCLRAKVVLFGLTGCIRAKVVVFG